MADKKRPWERGIIGYTRNFFGRLIGQPPRNEQMEDLGTGSPAVGRQVRQMSRDARESLEDVLPGTSSTVMTSGPAEETGETPEPQEREVGGGRGKGKSKGKSKGVSAGFDPAEADAERDAVESAEAEAEAQDRHGKDHGPPPHARGRALGHKKGRKA